MRLRGKQVLLLFAVYCFTNCSVINLKDVPQNQSVLIGSDVVFGCSANPSIAGNALKSQWRTNTGTLLGFHDSGVLAGYSGRYSYWKETPDELDLKIERVTLEDDGKFECQMVRFGEGQMRGAAFLNVLVRPTVVYFLHYRQGDAIEVSEGQAINITCVVPNAKPAPTTEWYMNGKLIADSSENRESYNLNKTITLLSSLYWRPTRNDHKKVLTCQAEHSATSSSLRASVSLNVLYSSERPRVSVVSEDEIVRAGQNVTLMCSVSGGNPLPNVTWYFDRHYIDSPSFYDASTQETINRYSFIADSKDNGAEYECRSSNRPNIAPLRGSVRLKVSFPAGGVDIYANSSIRREERAFVTCRTRPSNPSSRIAVSVNGIPLREPEQFEEVVSNGFVTTANFSIDLKDFQVKDHQIVVDCTAQNSEGNSAKQHVIRILSPPLQPLVYGFDHGPIFEGERLNLTCESHGGNPLAALSWFRGVEKLKESRSTVTGDVAHSYLSILVDRTLNRVPIRCQAFNDALDHPLVSSKNVEVLFPPRTVSIQPLNNNQVHLKAGEEAVLKCVTSSSNPESEIKWDFHGRTVQWKSETVQNNSNAEHHGSEVENIVTFKATEDLDSAVISCIASNPRWAKSTSASYNLSVAYSPKIVVDGEFNVVIGEGESFRENLTVFANPPINSWIWRRNGSPLQPVDGGTIFTKNGMIGGHRVARTDAGIYTVYASNAIGTSNATIRLSVEFPAEVTHITSPVIASVSDDVELECVVEAFPRKKGMVRWFKDGVELPSIIRDDRRAALRVNASEDTSGEYHCIADNGLGSPHVKKAFLLVNKPPQISRQPAFSRAAAAPGGRAEVVCRADGVPDCVFKWQIENAGDYINSNTTKYAFTSNKIDMDTYESRLFISEINPNDYKKRVRCIAYNRHGRDEILIPVGPLTTPDLPFEITVANITDDSVLITWLPGFNGGSSQMFEVRYRIVASDSDYLTVNTSESSVLVSGLPAGRAILTQLRSVNQHGFSSEFSEPIRAITLNSASPGIANLSEAEEQYPKFVMIIFGVGLLLLLLVNCLLLAYLHRRQKIKKIQEKTEIVRTHHGSDDGVRHVQMYGTMALTPQEMTRRAESEMTSRCEQPLNEHCGSEDDHSVRTMIEVNPNGYMQQIGTQFFDSNCLVDYEFDPALYSDIVRHGAPIESSYCNAPDWARMDECPSIDETATHDLFSEFNTIPRADPCILDSPARQPRRDAGYMYQASHNVDCGTISGRSTHSLSTFLQPGGVRTASTNYSILDGDLV